MDIEIYSDLVCPWCYIGKRRLEQALATYDGDVTIHYRPFQLDPSPVPEPVPLVDALGAKFGGVDRAREIFAHTTAVAATVGLELHFDRAVAANTLDAHRLVRFAADRGRAAETVDGLFAAHFREGADLGLPAALAAVAAGAGLDESEALAYLASDAGAAEVRAELTTARQLGITSVPTFVLAGRYAVTGAQEPETLRAALTEVAQREAAAG